jgi:hypothetical protein
MAEDDYTSDQEIENLYGEEVEEISDGESEKEEVEIEQPSDDFKQIMTVQEYEENIKINTYITGNERITAFVISQPELAAILRIRIIHLDQGAIPKVAARADNKSTAIAELYDKKLDYYIIRPVRQGVYELFQVHELIIPSKVKVRS